MGHFARLLLAAAATTTTMQLARKAACRQGRRTTVLPLRVRQLLYRSSGGRSGASAPSLSELGQAKLALTQLDSHHDSRQARNDSSSLPFFPPGVGDMTGTLRTVT